jgi:DNA-binding CsgD family transcriptional regulator
MQLDRFNAVLQSLTSQELLDSIVAFANSLGFQTISTTLVIDGPADATAFLCLDNTPSAYREVFEDLGSARRDPVMQHCKRAATPLVWNQETYVSVGKGGMWERQACFGYRFGIALALHLPQHRHFFVGVDRDQALPADADLLGRMVADLQLFAVYAQEAATRVLLPPAQAHDIPNLTKREMEALLWTMEGKTAWEVGRILGISEQTVVRHVNKATQKLDGVNKHHAVVKAMRLGIIR